MACSLDVIWVTRLKGGGSAVVVVGVSGCGVRNRVGLGDVMVEVQRLNEVGVYEAAE